MIDPDERLVGISIHSVDEYWRTADSDCEYRPVIQAAVDGGCDKCGASVTSLILISDPLTGGEHMLGYCGSHVAKIREGLRANRRAANS